MAVSFATPDIPEANFCSMMANHHEADPLGSAPPADAFFVLEIDLPWRREVSETPHLPEGLNEVLDVAANDGRTVRLLGIVPNPSLAKPGFCRVMYFDRPKGAFVQFQKTEYLIPQDEIVSLAQALVHDNSSLPSFSPYLVDTANVRDFLVCTHGARDACCGKFGYDIYAKLSAYATANPELNMRVWRSSHLGGHRFAPTLLDLPTGTYWGYVHDEILQELVAPSDVGTQLGRHYRGCPAMATPHEQVAEGELFRRIGRAWFSYERTTQVLAYDEDRNEATVYIDWAHPDTDAKGAARITVGIGRRITSPKSCGDVTTSWEEYRVTHFEEMS